MKPAGSFVIGLFFALTIMLVLLGVIMVLSSSQFVLAKDPENNVYQYMGRQLMWFSIGLACLGFFSAVDYNRWENYSRFLIVVTLALLALVFSPLGIEWYGSKRWIGYGGIAGQPSDLAKLTVIFYLAAVWAGKEDRLQSFWKGVFFPMLVVGFVLFLIVMQPDNGTTFFIGVTAAVIWFVAGGRLLHLLPAAVAFSGGVFYAIYSKPSLYKRIVAFLNPEDHKNTSYYQVYQSLMGFAYGGVWGTGLGEGRQQLFIPFPHNDFIFSVMGEELGFIKCALVVLMYMLLILLGYYTALKCGNPFGTLVAIGCTTAIGFQAALNIAVVTGSIPPTGISLPFISYGGSSLLISMSMIGILISIAKETFLTESAPRTKRKRARRSSSARSEA